MMADYNRMENEGRERETQKPKSSYRLLLNKRASKKGNPIENILMCAFSYILIFLSINFIRS